MSALGSFTVTLTSTCRVGWWLCSGCFLRVRLVPIGSVRRQGPSATIVPVPTDHELRERATSRSGRELAPGLSSWEGLAGASRVTSTQVQREGGAGRTGSCERSCFLGKWVEGKSSGGLRGSGVEID